MPRIKRWFPVSHDINSDIEVWQLTNQFGVTGLRAWLEVLSIADRNDGMLPGLWTDYPRMLAGRCQSTTRHLVGVCQFISRWLVIDCQGIARVVNYSKYHRTEERKPVPTRPDRTRPDLTLKNKINTNSSVVEFPSDWKWLENWVKRQNGGFPADRFLDWQWWDVVSEACGGLSESWLETQSAKWRRWIMDNPTRAPTPKGYRRFVAGWLERSYNQERRQVNGKGTR